VMEKPRILCVDDEQLVLDGLKANLYRRFDVATATGGAAALAMLAAMPSLPVAIVSDMRMPGMDGATFLTRARTAAPSAVRLLLTGQSDMTAAIAAVNEGQIFRFLTKPCAAPALIAALDAAVEQHRLVTAEKVLLEQTLLGCVKAMTDILSLTSPLAFGRATRIRAHVTGLLDQLGVKDRWQADIAAMLSQLGAITLPPEVAEKLYHGHALGLDEQRMVARVPAVTEQLLGNIPRLETVRAILAAYPKPPNRATQADGTTTARDAAILRLAVDFDALESQGTAPEAAVEILRSRAELYEPAILDALVALHGARAREMIKEVTLAGLQVGMVLAEDLMRTDGMLLLARGVEIAAGVIERMKNFRPGTVREPIRVSIRDDGGEALSRLVRK
jgi:CheY-like chemotaxis protein